ncbi:DNA-binding response regulator, NarL/FixJ family, contains REC and HTH domains [Nakamurella panacisegetis]|uniref:DNA-binding response regulator, NarL/FixJ family, contains REC and HTH domains n=1 Tax=Nakamurella panacisegetis TaxID=1090615 RepID=A0A1H0KRQ7_9ACTN|nr:response regulator transcription factor [Nakamurella panacisegetis]SDO58555.1 DNA-binding response regulator, NarL/FixJ family, contains REC and HTH domains [Nakamurella panacisegetis]
MIRVLVVDDDALVRAGLTMILSSADDLEIVGEAADGAEVPAAVARYRPDVVLMDIRMPTVDGLEATQRLRATANAPKVVVLTTFDLDDFVFRALQAGAAGFLLKDTPPRELIQAIRVVAAGEAMLSPTVTRTLIGHFAADRRDDRRSVARQRIAGLTPRELEALTAVGRGLSNAEIGRELFLSEATVKTHVSRLLLKLGVANRVQVAILAHEAGLLET